MVFYTLNIEVNYLDELDYQQAYLQLFNAVTDAVAVMNDEEAKVLLLKAQIDAEALCISG